MPAYLLALDQGTTGSTALVVTPDGEIRGRATREFPQHFPTPGWVEHDVEEIWASVVEALAEARAQAGVGADACLGVGITNQRETTVLWERAGGRAVHRAIVWQDRRTADRCAALRGAGLEETFRARTGLLLDPYFSGTKLAWLLDHVPGARERAEQGALAFGTIDSYLAYRLSGGELHVTDVTNASRTLLFDIERLAWDPELCRHLRIPGRVLPAVRGSAEPVGVVRAAPGLKDGTPITGMAGDQHAALFGQACFGVGDAKCTYGTGAFMLLNTGRRPIRSRQGLITTPAWSVRGEVTYALEGSAFIAGAAVQWLRDGLGLIAHASDVEALARQVPSSGDVVFVPALTGLGAPHWDPHARGLITGLTRDTTAAHLARATLEGIAFQVSDLAEAMALDAGAPLSRLRADGGAAKNDLLMQFQADLVGVPVDRARAVESTGLGAAYLAGLGAGVFPSLEAIRALHAVDRAFTPTFTDEARRRERARWLRAVARCRSGEG